MSAEKSGWTVTRVVIALVVFYFAYQLATPRDPAAPAQTSAPPPSVTTNGPSEPPPPTWQVTAPTDAMSGKVVKIAELRSVNSERFAFPYQGDTYATLYVRHRDGGPYDVMVRLDRGQIICHTENCGVQIRLDDDPPQTLEGLKPNDGSANAVFLPGAKSLYAKIRKAKLLHVALTIYKQGTVVYEFEVQQAPGI